MSRLERLVADVRPGVELRALAVHDDEAVLAGADEVFRLPLQPSGATRLAVGVAALAVLRTRLPVAVAVPRWVGVMPDGATPFSAEPLLAGAPAAPVLGGIAAGQLAGVRAALAATPAREARQWGVDGDGELLVASASLLADPTTGVLTGLVGLRLRLVAEPVLVDPHRLSDA